VLIHQQDTQTRVTRATTINMDGWFIPKVM